jgi:hypothetical protein
VTPAAFAGVTPEQGLSGQDVTPDEAEGFKKLTRAEFDLLAVDVCKSFSMDAMRKAGCSGEELTAQELLA